MLFGKRYCPIGLDFGSKFVKAVQLREERGKFVLFRYAVADLAAGCLDKGVIVDQGVLKKTLKQLLKNGFKDRAVNFCISGQQIRLHTSLFPALSDGELREAAYWEMEQELKGEIDDPVVDCLVIGEEEQEGQLMLKVLIAAVPRAVVRGYLSVLEGVGLEPSALEIKQIPLFRMLQGCSPERGRFVLILDIGAEETIFVVTDGEKIATAGGIDMGIDSPEGFSAETLLVEIQRLLKFFNANIFDEKKLIRQLFLAGGGSSIKGVFPYLKENLQVGVQIMDPFSTFFLPGRGLKDQEFYNLVPLFMVALGSSMRRYT